MIINDYEWPQKSPQVGFPLSLQQSPSPSYICLRGSCRQWKTGNNDNENHSKGFFPKVQVMRNENDFELEWELLQEGFPLCNVNYD